MKQCEVRQWDKCIHSLFLICMWWCVKESRSERCRRDAAAELERKMAAERDRQRLFAQALIRAPGGCLFHLPICVFPSLILTSAHLSSPANHSSGTNSAALEHRTLGCRATTHWLDGVEGDFRGLCENSIGVLIRPESPISPTTHTQTMTACNIIPCVWRMNNEFVETRVFYYTNTCVSTNHKCQKSNRPSKPVVVHTTKSPALFSLVADIKLLFCHPLCFFFFYEVQWVDFLSPPSQKMSVVLIITETVIN